MKKIILSIFVVCGLAASAQNNSELIGNTKGASEIASKDTAQGWKKGGVFTLNFSNVGLSNWAAGGSNSMSLSALTDMHANYKMGKVTWDNNLILGLGMIKQFANGTKSSDVDWVKSDDKIDFTSKYGRKINDQWYYSGLFNFKSQFLEGYLDPYAPDTARVTISRLFAPAYAIAAIGVDYKPNKNFSVFIAPVTAKITIVNDSKLNSVGAFGVDSNEVIRTEMGFYLKALYAKDIAKNVNFKTTFELFQNYQNIGHIDVNWETMTSMKVNEYITATFATTLIYDDDIAIAQEYNKDTGLFTKSGPAVQFKHVLSVGLAYKF